MKKGILCLLLVAFLVGLVPRFAVMAGGNHSGGHGHGPSGKASQGTGVERDEASIAAGNSLYQQFCASCHGPEARGDGKAGLQLSTRPPNLVVMSAHHSKEEFRQVIREGRGEMPAWKDEFDEREIEDLVTFIKSLNGGDSAGHHHHGAAAAHGH